MSPRASVVRFVDLDEEADEALTAFVLGAIESGL